MRIRQDFKMVGGIKLHKTDFASAPSNNLEDGKLPVNANQVEAAPDIHPYAGVPVKAKHGFAQRIARTAKSHNGVAKKTGRFRKNHLAAKSAGHGIPVLLQDLGAPATTPDGTALHTAGSQLYEIPVAVTGSWVKDDHAFSITPQDMGMMVRNFEKRKNDQVVIDYEHASEMPEVAKGGPVPAAGWIHDLRMTTPYPPPKLAEGRGDLLRALVEWTPQAEQMIKSGEYRFFSPAIDWSAIDKETGEPQGATLTSGALTNHPFLEELPPIMLRDGVVVEAVRDRLMRDAQRAPLQLREGEIAMKTLKLRPIPEGEENAGHHAVVDEETGATVGLIPHDDLTEYAAHHLGVNPDAKQDEEENTGAEHIESQVLSTEAHDARRRAFFLSEAVQKGKIDNQRAGALADAGKITLADYIQAQEAERLIESAITAGKILPRDRAFFFRDALDRPKEFIDFIRNTSPVVRWGTKGIGSAEILPVDEEIDLGVKRLMSEKGLDYAKALKQFLAAHPGIGEQYRRKHTHSIPAETPAQ